MSAAGDHKKKSSTVSMRDASVQVEYVRTYVHTHILLIISHLLQILLKPLDDVDAWFTDFEAFLVDKAYKLSIANLEL